MKSFAVSKLELRRQLRYAPRIMLRYQLLTKLRLLTAGCQATTIVHLTKLLQITQRYIQFKPLKTITKFLTRVMFQPGMN